MEKREKILAGGLGSVVLLWGALSLYDNQIAAPLKAKGDQLLKTQEDSRKSLKEWRGLIRSQKLVRDAVNDCLPPDGQDAQRVYLKWVQELAELSGWQEISPNKNLDARGQLGKIGVRIPVTLTAKAKLKQVAQFLWHFERADLLQRVSSLHLTSPTAEGDPDLTVVITVEGVSLAQAAPRKRLYPESEITAAIDPQSTSISVSDVSGFPSAPPFRVRLGTEFAMVTTVDGPSWTVVRGVDETVSMAHAVGASIEYAPARTSPAGDEKALTKYAQLINRSGFVKPAPIIDFKPKLATTTLPILTRGEPWTPELRVEGWNPRWPVPMFELTGAPDGLTVSSDGKLEWKVPAETQAGDFPFKVLAKAGDVARVETELRITLREKNRPPKFSPVAQVRAFVGRPLRLPVIASDDDPGTRLTYAFNGQVPEGMAIDVSTGVVTWTPPETLDAAPVRVQVAVTDNGTPPLTSTLEISGQLDDDHAEYTFVVGYVDKGDSRLALLNDRLTNTTTPVSVGDRYSSSDLELVVDSIDSDGVSFRQGPNRLRVDIGQNLRTAKLLPPTPQIPPPPPVTETLGKSPDAARD